MGFWGLGFLGFWVWGFGVLGFRRFRGLVCTSRGVKVWEVPEPFLPAEEGLALGVSSFAVATFPYLFFISPFPLCKPGRKKGFLKEPLFPIQSQLSCSARCCGPASLTRLVSGSCSFFLCQVSTQPCTCKFGRYFLRPQQNTLWECIGYGSSFSRMPGLGVQGSGP